MDVSGPGNQGQLWMRVDLKGGGMGFFDNMQDRPIVAPGWHEYTITGDVAEDAERIVLGLMLIGRGRAWIDAASFQVVGQLGEGNEPPRRLDERGLENLVAFTKLLGYVRYFHPSDEAAATDWNQFAIDGVRAVEPARDAEDLVRILDRLFHPIAPSVRAFVTGKPPAQNEAPRDDGKKTWPKVLAWRHIGVGLGQSTPYSSERIDLRFSLLSLRAKLPVLPVPDPRKPYAADLGGGVSCLVPMALYTDEKGTLPRAEQAKPANNQAPLPPLAAPRPASFEPSGNDRATRLAVVVLAWNVFQHFYPYFDVVDADWPAELHKALAQAALDANEQAFMKTLNRLVAALHDGHGGAYGPGSPPFGSFPPLGWDWIEGQLVVTGVAPSGAGDLKPGDVVDQIDGKAAAKVLAECETMISGATPQWRRQRALNNAAAGTSQSEITLKVHSAPEKTDATPPGDPQSPSPARTVMVRRTMSMRKFLDLKEPRPLEKIATLKPCVVYLDLSRVSQEEFDRAAAKLADARGVIFDLRGYPNSVTPATIGHLTDKPVTCAQWLIPVTYTPDRQNVGLSFSNWTVEPAKPRFHGKVAFLTDGRAISYAETYLGIIEHYKLAPIVGGPTAGTNGNVNPLTLPGGIRIAWTGMKVLKHDGSRHHGVGIQPTVPVERTIRGVAAGRDEVLERALAMVEP
jgi:hypothetical protein